MRRAGSRGTACCRSVYPLQLRIAVPFLNQVRDGFASACTIEVGGEVLRTSMHGKELVAETTLAGRWRMP